jgi:uncharacterized membrane protein
MIYFKATLLTSSSQANDLTETILETINEKKPQSVKQLAIILRETLNLQEKEMLEVILKLQAQGIIKLEDHGQESRSLASYATGRDLWYWLTMGAVAITATLVFIIPENLYPWIYVRNFFGVIFVLFLPGFAFVKALFPANLPEKISSEFLEKIEQIAISVGLSISIVLIFGLILYYIGALSLPFTIISLFVFTSIFATVGIIRSTNNTRGLQNKTHVAFT